MNRQLQFCAGGNQIPGWESFDQEVDIRQPLPFPNGCARAIFCEHGLEHVTHQQGWRFLAECRRVLYPGGHLRIAIPDIERMFRRMNPSYAQAASDKHTCAGAIEAAIFNHGHQSAWTGELLRIVLISVAFNPVSYVNIGQSLHPHLCGLERHGRTVGEDINATETTVLEATRPEGYSKPLFAK